MKRRQINMDNLKRIFETKRILLAAAMMLALPALILCQTNAKKGNYEQEVQQTLNDLAAALRSNDSTALDRIYADGYTFVGDTGVLMTKAQRIAAFKSGELKYESISFDDVNIHIYGDTAVATFSVTSKFAPGVKSLGGKFITTATFVKIKGRWEEVAAHNTRIGE
ncbi:MAG: nuclear transport factor 2 family protein [Pyrinomonadaceae bacterium]